MGAHTSLHCRGLRSCSVEKAEPAQVFLDSKGQKIKVRFTGAKLKTVHVGWAAHSGHTKLTLSSHAGDACRLRLPLWDRSSLRRWLRRGA